MVDGFNNAANNFSHLRLAQLVPPRTSQIIPTNSKVSRQASITTDAIFSNKEEYEKKHRIIVQKEKSMVPASTFNLIKAIIGSGVLALPAGVAAMSDHKKR